MCVGSENSTQEQGSDAPSPQQKPTGNTHGTPPNTCHGPRETLIERVVDFMDTYDES